MAGRIAVVHQPAIEDGRCRVIRRCSRKGKAVPQKGATRSAAKNTAGATKNMGSKSAPPEKSGARKTKGA
jgi:hypothetical protein